MFYTIVIPAILNAARDAGLSRSTRDAILRAVQDEIRDLSELDRKYYAFRLYKALRRLATS